MFLLLCTDCGDRFSLLLVVEIAAPESAMYLGWEGLGHLYTLDMNFDGFDLLVFVFLCAVCVLIRVVVSVSRLVSYFPSCSAMKSSPAFRRSYSEFSSGSSCSVSSVLFFVL